MRDSRLLIVFHGSWNRKGPVDSKHVAACVAKTGSRATSRGWSAPQHPWQHFSFGSATRPRSSLESNEHRRACSPRTQRHCHGHELLLQSGDVDIREQVSFGSGLLARLLLRSMNRCAMSVAVRETPLNVPWVLLRPFPRNTRCEAWLLRSWPVSHGAFER